MFSGVFWNFKSLLHKSAVTFLNSGVFTLRDMYEQFQNIMKMGPFSQIMVSCSSSNCCFSRKWSSEVLSKIRSIVSVNTLDFLRTFVNWEHGKWQYHLIIPDVMQLKKTELWTFWDLLYNSYGNHIDISQLIFIRSYLIVTSAENVVYEHFNLYAQFNFFFSWKSCVPFYRYSIFIF